MGWAWASGRRASCELGLVCSSSFAVLLLICHPAAAAATATGPPTPTSYADADADGDGDAAFSKVRLSLYYESLCPYCARFIVNKLVKVFHTDLISIINLRLVPWGNTIITSNGTWICQHGSDECLLDMVEACAINAWPNPDTYFRLIHCIESIRLNNLNNKWQSCFASVGLDDAPIRNCFNTGLAIKLEHGYADETAHLNPPHRFVPWVLVNNQPLQEDFENFVAYICKVYKGNKLPQACRSHPVSAAASFTRASYVMNSENSSSVSAAQLAKAENIWLPH